MKTRNGFVSNSSSSSFIINSEYTEDQIRSYIEKLLEAESVLYDIGNINDLLTIYTTDDSDEHRLEYYNWGCWDNKKELTLKEFKKINNRENTVEKAVIVDSIGDNSIPWKIQQMLEEIGERYHWG